MTTTAFADEPLQSERLKEINLKVAALQDEQKSLGINMSANEKALSKLTLEITNVQERMQANSTELKNLREASTKISVEIDDYTLRYKELEDQSSARLRALYMMGGGSQMAIKVSSEGRAGLSQISHYMGALRAHEVSSLAELKRLGQERTIRIEALSAKSKELEKLNKEATDQHEELRAKQLQLENTKATLKKQRNAKVKVLSELRAEALRLETVLSSLLESGDGGAQNDGDTIFTDKSKDQRLEKAETSEVAPVVGDGLSSKFPPPVRGPIVTKYGARVSDGLEQQVASKGLGFAAPVGQDVVAVGDGQVSFVGVLGAYGNVIIIDHNFRVCTLYSQLASISVERGQTLKSGDIIGKTGELTAPKPFNLYFELRKQGLALDPKPFMQ
jgi:septal ring factor EnvC (AmiA/AmiB activator)